MPTRTRARREPLARERVPCDLWLDEVEMELLCGPHGILVTGRHARLEDVVKTALWNYARLLGVDLPPGAFRATPKEESCRRSPR